MTLQSFAASILLLVSGLLGVSPIAADLNGWSVKESWHEIQAVGSPSVSHMSLTAESTAIVDDCRKNQNGYVAFPAVIHGSHLISVDGHVVMQFGDPSFESTRSFYGQPVIGCGELIKGAKVTWQVFSYTKYFARISFFPTVSTTKPVYNVFAETFHIIGAGAGILMAIFTFTIFAGKVSRPTTLSVCASSFFSSLYLGGCVAGFMGMPGSMLWIHKIADIGVWLSISSLVNALRHEGLVSRRLAVTYFVAVIVAIIIILLGTSGDLVQLGTTIPFLFTLYVLTVPMLVLGRTVFTVRSDRRVWLQFFALGSFVLAVFNEMFAVTGLIHSSPMLPFGFMAGVMFLALSVNEKVEEAYRERDHLRDNLENEVERKTAELKTAMNTLQTTQAELVQSAKLASLGTLSAGIAHEINNSINYVNGAIQPLEKLISNSCRPEDRSKIDKLFVVMKEGLGLTLEIIKSLRNYTGLNQAKFNDVKIATVVQSTLTILRSKLRDRIEVLIDVPDHLQVFGSVVGINQVFMNLISNAIDAMPEKGKLSITAFADGKSTRVMIRDSGHGMSPEIINRMFEPFFTTKEVGRGTGLGLHIVRTEMDRHHGTIEVESVLGNGTCFTLTFPRGAVDLAEERAA